MGKKLFLAALALLICCVATGAATGWLLLTVQREPAADQRLSSILIDCQTYSTLETAAEKASYIVYGTMGEQSHPYHYVYYRQSGSVIEEYYWEREITVLRLLKGDPDVPPIYRERHGETREMDYRVDNADPAETGKTYVIFLSRVGTFITPSTLIPVENGMVSPSRGMLPAHLRDLEECPSLPVEEYLDAVQAYLEEAGLENTGE